MFPNSSHIFTTIKSAMTFSKDLLPLMLSSRAIFSPGISSCRHRTNFILAVPKFPNRKTTIPKTMTSTMSNLSRVSKEYVGKSGRTYKIERVLQEEEEFPPRRVYLATWVSNILPRVNLLIVFHSANNHKFILKYIHEINYDDLQHINNKLRDGGDHVRLAQDTVPEQSMFVFEYFTDHLLHLAQKDLPTETRKKILKDALQGIAELHDHDIVHTGAFYRFLDCCKYLLSFMFCARHQGRQHFYRLEKWPRWNHYQPSSAWGPRRCRIYPSWVAYDRKTSR